MPRLQPRDPAEHAPHRGVAHQRRRKQTPLAQRLLGIAIPPAPLNYLESPRPVRRAVTGPASNIIDSRHA